MPEVVISDGGSEFKNDFERALEQHNILQIICDAANPWQNGKAERHGGWVKERVEQELASGQCVVITSEELDELVSCVVSHKNRWFSRVDSHPVSWCSAVTHRSLLTCFVMSRKTWHGKTLRLTCSIRTQQRQPSIEVIEYDSEPGSSAFRTLQPTKFV